MTPQKRRALYERLQAAMPKPTTELEYSTPFELLVAVILSAQATDKSVNAVTRKLFPVARTPQAIAKMGVARLSKYIRSIGLWQAKAKNVVATASAIADEHGGEVPRSREALEALPGVGRKTANVVLNTIFGEPTIAVDTHIFRVANRTRLAVGETPRAVEDALVRFTPGEFARDAHHWLILHGRYVCKALKPECWRCPISDLCEWPERRKVIAHHQKLQREMKKETSS
jgi:endonuclease-3